MVVIKKPKRSKLVKLSFKNSHASGLLNLDVGFYRITCIKLVSKEMKQKMDQCE